MWQWQNGSFCGLELVCCGGGRGFRGGGFFFFGWIEQFREEGQHHEDGYADDNADVCDIEGGPEVFAAVSDGVKVEEIDDVSIADAVDEVSDGSANDHAEGQLDDKCSLVEGDGPDNDADDHYDGYGEDYPGLFMEKGEGSAGVFGPAKIKKAGYDLYGAAKRITPGEIGPEVIHG